jgi:hypothetical protein
MVGWMQILEGCSTGIAAGSVHGVGSQGVGFGSEGVGLV